MRRDPFDAVLDSQPEGNSDNSIWRDHLGEPCSPFYDLARRMVAEREHFGRKARRRRRMASRLKS